ncbi:MAG: flagellar hook-basal body complex protein [Oscillospiraceae bacterium]
MVKSLYSGVSGLKTHQQRMDVIGNNIANVNTTGYKTNVVTFSDIYYQTKRTPSGTTSTLGGVNPRQVGYGVQMNTTTPNMTQSGFNYSDSIYDLALDGEGFFQLMDGAGNLLYTRAGVFNVDEEGYLVNANGFHVLGVSGDSNGQPARSEIIRITIPDTQAKASSATKNINGVDVTVSVNSPSDNTDMSVTFTDGDYPFATYSGGILNIIFDKDQQFASEQDFQNAITEAINAGGITLPDDVSLIIEFGSIPGTTEAQIAKTKGEGITWEYTMLKASGEWIASYVDGTTNKTAAIGFNSDDESLSNCEVTLTYGTSTAVDLSGLTYDDATKTYSGTVAVTVADDTTAAIINDLIKTQLAASTTLPDSLSLKCDVFRMPSDPTLRSTVLTTGTIKLETAKEKQFSVSAKATEPGAYANNYKITFDYNATYGATKAVWDENNLRIVVCPDTTVQDIKDAITAAADGDPKKLLEIEISGLEDAGGVSMMNTAMRKALFGGNPSFSLGDGADSFFTEVAKSLSTFNLTDGRTGSAQSYKDLENVTVQKDGTIIGYHSVFGYMTLGRVDIATFDNPNGLTQVGGTCFMETVASGEAKLCIAGSEGAGNVISMALEMSNVDLAQEFTDMITTQRGYQANSRVITTSDTMLEELLNLKR